MARDRRLTPDWPWHLRNTAARSHELEQVRWNCAGTAVLDLQVHGSLDDLTAQRNTPVRQQWMEAGTGAARFSKAMGTVKNLLVGCCAALVGLGPLAAQTSVSLDLRPVSEPVAITPVGQSAGKLAAPRAVQIGGLAVGDYLNRSQLHVITRPGLYGLNGSAPRDSYGIVDGLLVRFDPDTLQLRSIIRAGVKAID